MTPILVINPNSSAAITSQIAAAVEPIADTLGVHVTTVGSPAGPVAIESDGDVQQSVAPMLDVAAGHPANSYVVGCFSDPGIEELRAATGRPVFGIAQCAVLAAMARGRRVGIVSSVATSVPRHERYWQRVGVSSHVVADIPVRRGVLDLAGADAARDVESAAVSLVTEYGADVIVLGCAGMAHLRAGLQDEIGVPVVEPCRAAVAAAAIALIDQRAASAPPGGVE